MLILINDVVVSLVVPILLLVILTPNTSKKGKSKFSFFDNFVLALDGILSFSTRILTLVTVFGLTISLISFLLLVYIILGKFLTEIFVPGYAALMVTISFFSGVIIIMLGLIGASIERIFLEVKNRPKFIVKETWGIES